MFTSPASLELDHDASGQQADVALLMSSPTAPDAGRPSGNTRDDVDFGIDVLSIVLSSLGILGNAFVCFVMLRHRKVFHSVTNKLIIHQSAIDLLAATVFICRRIALARPPISDSFLGKLYCRVWWSEWPMYAMFVTSTYNLVAISTERYLATCYPLRHRRAFSPWRLRLFMVMPWLAGWTPTSHLAMICYHDPEKLACDTSWPSPKVQAAVGIFIFIQEIIIPILIMLFTYTRIIWTLRVRSRVRDGENNAAAREMFSKANRNVTVTLIVVAAFFAICWLPTDIYYLLFNLDRHNNFVDDFVYQMMTVFVVINLCINPLIYCFAYDRFRRQLRETLCGGRGRFRTRRIGNAVDRDIATSTAGSQAGRSTAQDGTQASANVATIATACPIPGCSTQSAGIHLT